MKYWNKEFDDAWDDMLKDSGTYYPGGLNKEGKAIHDALYKARNGFRADDLKGRTTWDVVLGDTDKDSKVGQYIRKHLVAILDKVAKRPNALYNADDTEKKIPRQDATALYASSMVRNYMQTMWLSARTLDGTLDYKVDRKTGRMTITLKEFVAPKKLSAPAERLKKLKGILRWISKPGDNNKRMHAEVWASISKGLPYYRNFKGAHAMTVNHELLESYELLLEEVPYLMQALAMHEEVFTKDAVVPMDKLEEDMAAMRRNIAKIEAWKQQVGQGADLPRDADHMLQLILEDVLGEKAPLWAAKERDKQVTGSCYNALCDLAAFHLEEGTTVQEALTIMGRPT